MTGKIHVLVGGASLALLAVNYPKGFEAFNTTILPVVGLVTSMAGSYAPDIDMGRTHSGMKHKTASKVISKVGGGHRGITHTLLVPTIVAVLMWFVGSKLTGLKYLTSLIQSLLFGWEFGYCMHLFADMFNGKGIPLFWPIMKGKVHIMDVDSNGWQAWLWAFAFIGIMGFLTFKGVLFG